MTTAERVRKTITRDLGTDADRLKDEASIIDDLGADSLDLVELVLAFEEEFNIEISDAECEETLTVGDAIKLVEKKLGA